MAKAPKGETAFSEEEAKTSYERWVESEGIPVIKAFFVEDVRTVKLAWWERKGGYGAFLQMEGAAQVNNCYICEIPPGKSLRPQRHLFEETVYIVSGAGATTVWNQKQKKQTFEWQTGSLFSPPLNSWHQHFNAGREPARYLALRAFGSKKYRGIGKPYKGATDRKKGGEQIGYDEEDSMVRKLFEEALARKGVQSQMEKYYQKNP